MPSIGNTSKPTQTFHGYGGSSQVNQEAELLTMPERGELVRLGIWIGGWGSTCRVKMAVWDTAGVLLGESAQFTVTDVWSDPGDERSALYEADLAAPITLPTGAQFYVGFARHPDDAHIVTGGGVDTEHYEDISGGGIWPRDFAAGFGGAVLVNRRVGCHVVNYVAKPGAYVRRAGTWVDAPSAIRRSGTWPDATLTAARRGAAWNEGQ